MQFRDGTFVIDDLDKLHHAYLVEGGEATQNALLEALGESGVAVAGNPDVHVRNFDTLGIDAARDLVVTQGRRSVGGERTFFIITAQSVTHQAQNSLLKAFEEPAPQTYFFVIIPRLASILPTVRSRAHEVVAGKETSDAAQKQSKSFVAAVLPGRLKIAKQVADTGERDQVRNFVSALEAEVAGGSFQNGSMVRFKEEVAQSHEYLEQHGANVKTVLENLALQYPEEKVERE